MRRRILQSTLLVVAITALVLGGPLAATTWQLVEDIARADLTSRLEVIAERLEDQDPGSVDPAIRARMVCTSSAVVPDSISVRSRPCLPPAA